MKNFETHLELIFEVLARAGSVKSLGFCVWRRIPHKEAVLEPGPQELVWRIYISLGYMPSAPPHCTWLPHGGSPIVTLNPTFRPVGSGSCAGWSHCRAKDGGLQTPAAFTQLILRAEAWCSHSCMVESGFKGEHILGEYILVPHSPMCLRWPSAGAGSYVEKTNSSLF